MHIQHLVNVSGGFDVARSENREGNVMRSASHHQPNPSNPLELIDQIGLAMDNNDPYINGIERGAVLAELKKRVRALMRQPRIIKGLRHDR